ncbi:guanylate kinase [Aurantiacibacter poecillastricola]|uniref:guanylate kinase n=1 Tax=Aurantiacibacter poecillastricola TaxID=3064385 RepID=UPI0027401E2C|nr:guanylate kinase [Aurantiacibacter sp. 219JJ12-13]MDP5263481.1 guanylate kinase [Aurantiacibacter sp. 219JJ12-13]
MFESFHLPRRGLMFILSSPSGAGKTTIARKLLAVEQNLDMSVSVTTRPIRPGEVEGRDYFFTERAGFDAMVKEEAFLEWAEVFGNCYGTPRAHIVEGLERGQDFLFDVDWQGAQQLSQRAREDVVSVFLLPPDMGELERRLRARATDDESVIAGRMARAGDEISHWDAYDYVVINHELEDCFDKVRTILHAERLKRSRQTGLIDFTRNLKT